MKEMGNTNSVYSVVDLYCEFIVPNQELH